MKKTREIDLLKIWIDSEFTVLHIMFGIIMLQLTEGLWPTVFFGGYILFTAIYWIIRVAFIASIDKDYLKVPPK